MMEDQDKAEDAPEVAPVSPTDGLGDSEYPPVGAVAAGDVGGFVGAALGSGAALGAALKYGADLAKTALTERGETRREKLRQDGETERARIAKGTAAPTTEAVGDRGSASGGDLSTPRDGS
ncbi:hypothetical protein GCM10010441_19890 [Kitasatospora paracochleata]|uniref:Outer membrane lipoprotein SlyB n=1 Tax=Kitasatospora paracochleata TaxID=58354 RepID=A0ABT1J875_9ACTN|nr:hypothetical protein [Kitasatospora paracochleata]MCP2313630.1 outer membrane lipoprotein SlyB [Kitasatospora paracochleata]